MHMFFWRTLGTVILLVIGCGSIAEGAPAATWSTVITPESPWNFFLMKGDQAVLKSQMIVWGPGWNWTGWPESKERAKNGELKLSGRVALNPNNTPLTVYLTAHKSGERSISYTYELDCNEEQQLTQLVAEWSLAGTYTGRALIKFDNGREDTLQFPIRRTSTPSSVSSIEFQLQEAGVVHIAIDPPCSLHVEDGGIRIILARDTLKAGKQAVTLTINTEGPADFVAGDLKSYTKLLPGTDWFAFEPTNDVGPSVISMNDWLDKPAGMHGMAQIIGDHFEFSDGTRVKFWGVNLSYGSECCPVKKDADFTAARFAKYGVNAVRLHKFCGPDWEGIGDATDGTKLSAKGLDRLDYFCAALAKNGVYYGFSHSFGYKIRPGNRNRILAYDEIQKGLGGNTYGLINVAEDLQDLMIDMVVGLLKHANPYTGKTYAEDPALVFVELQNEDDIFWYSVEGALDACPTYKKDLIARYSQWLKDKYQTRSALARAWGGSLKAEETLDANTVRLQLNPWFMGVDGLSTESGSRQRMLDNAAFLHELQNRYYAKFVKAIRDAGYIGPLCGSPWQAPAMLPHYYNLLSDSHVGWIDRHNYFGSKIYDTTLKRPGSGILSSGLQQLIDRPFGVSEWIHVYPSLYSAEGPVLVAAYGLGLQGWSASFEFQSAASRGGFNRRVGWFPWGIWEIDTPSQIGQYPALARMLYRSDVKTGDIISVRNISTDELAQARFSFKEFIEQDHDIKKFGGTVPAAALAAGRCVIDFTETHVDSTLPNMNAYRKGDTIVSNTQQLFWDYTDQGYVTIDTPGTKGVVGFAEGKEFDLTGVTLAIHSPYVSLLVTALDRDSVLDASGSALVSVVARNSNTGMTYFTVDQRIMENGREPILLEPVKAAVGFVDRVIESVNILDHDGRRTERSLAVRDNSFEINGAVDKALYYEVVFKPAL